MKTHARAGAAGLETNPTTATSALTQADGLAAAPTAAITTIAADSLVEQAGQ